MEKSICIFGDSITWGSSDWEGGGWANRLRHYVDSLDDTKWQPIFVLGIPGDNTSKLLERFLVECLPRNPGMIVIAIGINDTYSEVSNGEPKILPSQFQQNISQLIRLSKETAEKVVFVGINHIDEIPRLSGHYFKNEVIDIYNGLLQEECGSGGVFFVSLAEILLLSDLDDGLHPNIKGHKKIFEVVKDFLIKQKLI